LFWVLPNAENAEGWEAFGLPKAEVLGCAPNGEFICVVCPNTEDVWGVPNVELTGGFSELFAGVVANALEVVGCGVAPKTDVGGGGPKADSVIVPGCDPPAPSVAGCPNAGACGVLPNADGVGFEG
jgi:hypothetical protein